ncbi:MAG: DUF1836 domain-containing protein [Oscillospiraceae bacterium]|nr:DUF1836 domain-containing protein [Oscillospiraceae bacterium]
MNWTVPGTTLTAAREDAAKMREQFQNLFLAGGIALSQVTSITGLDPYMIQNWVKRGFLAKPEQKRYSLNQLCRIITISMLKGVLPMERICGLLSYINGRLDDEADDIIDDAELYFIFLRLAARARELDTHNQWDQAIAATMADYEEPVPGARQRISQVLRIMLTAWVAARMTQEAEKMMGQLEIPAKGV